MALADEGNTSLAFDTVELRACGVAYAEIASELRIMASDLDTYLAELKDTGWTTPAGTAFHDMVQTNWEKNIEKYADLLDTLKAILDTAAEKYDALTTNNIECTKL